MESSQVLQTNSTETNTDTTVSLIPLSDVEPMESSVVRMELVDLKFKLLTSLWIRKGEPIGVISFQEIRFPNPLLVDIKELTVFLAQLLETKRKKKFTSSQSHIPGFNYPSTATSLEVFPSSMDDAVSTVPTTSEMQETAVDLSVNGDLNLDDTDDD
ncbi:unnamed protein product [Orchesella dallaii]|uniref:Uncharacterized protein n=1 Tax=Orchesella dallaii TaxID=48710 RepID=A0ABP1RD10_9HEXA